MEQITIALGSNDDKRLQTFDIDYIDMFQNVGKVSKTELIKAMYKYST